MKTLFIILWFLITIRTNPKQITEVIHCANTNQVDSILYKYNLPLKADSIFKHSKFLEIRKADLYIYIEQKNEKEK
jgi:hypothetical protein